MTYVYCRKPSNWDKNEIPVQIQKWADGNNINVDEIVWDDETKKNGNYKSRNLGKYLLPKLKSFDILIVSEISCIGRSASELLLIFNNYFISKKIHLICLSINLDIDFDKFTDYGRNFMSQLQFAADLQKTIVKETTHAALKNKKNSGVKLGSSNEKYRANYKAKSEEEKRKISLKRGCSRNRKSIEDPDLRIFVSILKNVFGLSDDIIKWNWKIITTREEYKFRIYEYMKQYQDKESRFALWDFSDFYSSKLQHKLASYIHSLKRKMIFYYTHVEIEDQNNFIQSINKISINPAITKEKNNSVEPSVIDKVKVLQVESNTQISQGFLSDIFKDSNQVDGDVIEDGSLSNSLHDLLRILFTKAIWNKNELHSLCVNNKIMLGAAIEQINDYAFNVVDDIVIEEDGNTLYVALEYKNDLLHRK